MRKGTPQGRPVTPRLRRYGPVHEETDFAPLVSFNADGVPTPSHPDIASCEKEEMRQLSVASRSCTASGLATPRTFLFVVKEIMRTPGRRHVPDVPSLAPGGGSLERARGAVVHRLQRCLRCDGERELRRSSSCCRPVIRDCTNIAHLASGMTLDVAHPVDRLRSHPLTTSRYASSPDSSTGSHVQTSSFREATASQQQRGSPIWTTYEHSPKRL